MRDTQALGHKEGIAIAYGNLGNVYQTQGDLEKAVQFYNKALALFREVGAAAEVALVQKLLENLRK